jgi:hypothetical protein
MKKKQHSLFETAAPKFILQPCTFFNFKCKLYLDFAPYWPYGAPCSIV